MPLLKQLGHQRRVRSIVVLFVAHILALTLSAAPAAAQGPSAAGSRFGVQIGALGGVALSPDPPEPLAARGFSQAVEVALVLPGGIAHEWALGVRGEVEDGSDIHELSLFGDVRVELLLEPGALGLMPVLRGGLRVARLRADATIGPHFGVGLERAVAPGVVTGLAVVAHGRLTIPMRVTVALAWTVRVGSP